MLHAPEQQSEIRRPAVGSWRRHAGRRLTTTGWGTAALICLAALAIFYTLDAARNFLMPAVLACVLAVILAPVCRGLEQLRLPSPLAAVCTVLLALTLTLSLLVPLAPAFDDWSKRLPQIARQLEFELRAVKESVEKLQAASDEVQKATNLNTDTQNREVVVHEQGPVTDAISSAPALVVQVFFATMLVYFLLSERRRLLRRAVSMMPTYAAARRLCLISREIGRVVSRYLFSVACINFGLGCATALVLFLFGVPNAPLWGTGMALLNFIPFLGPTIMLAIIFGASMATFHTAAAALLPVGAVLALNIIESQLVVPSIVGRRVFMDPLAVFFAVAFWGWLWGVPGAIIAVPVTIIIATSARYGLFARNDGDAWPLAR